MRKRKKLMIIILSLVLVLALTAVAGIIWLRTYVDPYHAIVADAGIVEKQAEVNQVTFNYAEGPDNGPALLLLNAQHLDWFSYSRVLPALSKQFHVFAVDYPGHGKTVCPEGYTMNAEQIGSDLGDFIQSVIGEPAFVTGNSSGGLLTVWLAANRPEWVKAVVLEDPPLFASEYPRIKETVAYKSFTTANQCVKAGETDFLTYFLIDNALFFERRAGKAALPAIKLTLGIVRSAHPNTPPELGFLPDTVEMMLRGMDMYDPAFGAAFYNGTWGESFDHAEALRKISCPALLIHANYALNDDGLLNGAMNAEEAARAAELIPNCEWVKVDAEHVTNLDHPEQFIQLVTDFCLDR